MNFNFEYDVIKNSNLFDVDFYHKKYPDVFESNLDPIKHYILNGVSEGCNPNSHFDTLWYLERYNDVKKKGMNPLVHYILYGKKEGRFISPVFSIYEDAFSIKDFSDSQIDAILENLLSKKISIIIPIYNAVNETYKCICSVLENTQLNYELILINDNSSDLRVNIMLDYFKENNNHVKIIKNEKNMGFVKNVNIGFINSGNNDVVLLNSDTIVTSKWLQKLFIVAYSKNNIGTVTPVSNNSGAFSVPNHGFNKIPDDFTLDEMANLVEKSSKQVFMSVPTGNGFCMYIKREVINDTGLFDEDFGKGYGEENDFCMRAINNGWINVIDDSTYIYHKNAASFSDSKKELMDKNRKLLSIKHPEYSSMVNDFLNSKELKFIRNNINDTLKFDDNESYKKRRILYVMHDGSGGTRLTSEDLMKIVSEKFECYFLTSDQEKLKLFKFENSKLNLIETYTVKKCFVKDEFLKEYRDTYFNILIKHCIDIVHIRHLIKHTFDLPYVAKKLGIPVVLSFHDFYFICPCYTLLNEEHKYCGGVCSNIDFNKNCFTPLKKFNKLDNTKKFLPTWRKRVELLFSNIDLFITTSDYVKDKFIEIYPSLNCDNFKVIEQGSDYIKSYETCFEVPDIRKPIKILFIGNISLHKGEEFIKKLYDFDKNSMLEIHFLGDTDKDLKNIGIHHGTYDKKDLPKLLNEIKPSFIGIFSIWAETYCHTLTEAWFYQIPVLSFDIGVVGKRMRENNGGFFIDCNNVRKAFDEIIRISKNKNEYLKIQKDLKNIQFKSSRVMAKEYLKEYFQLFNNKQYHIIDKIMRFDENKFNSVKTSNIINAFRNDVSIIVPIFNAYEDTKKCIESIIEYTSIKFNLILIDDNSTDKRISELLSKYKNFNNIQIIENKENKGFTKNVNMGLLKSGNNDVVLLNSDTIVTPYWLQKILFTAYSEQEIGTVTPISNASDISIPIMGKNNDIPSFLTLNQMSTFVENVSLNSNIIAPTGNGFCMFIKRDTINDVGLFDDDTFDRGYGEETDFTSRARKNGWKNVRDDSVLVYHKRSASFSLDNVKELKKEHKEKLLDKHPNVFEEWNYFIKSNKIKNLINNIQKNLGNFNKDLIKRNIVYCAELQEDIPIIDNISELTEKFNIFVITFENSGRLRLWYYINDNFKKFYEVNINPKFDIGMLNKFYVNFFTQMNIYKVIVNRFAVTRSLTRLYIPHIFSLVLSNQFGISSTSSKSKNMNIKNKLSNPINFKKDKLVIYTAIFGDYDLLIDPYYVNPDYDYVCFTDNPDIKSNIWDIRLIEDLKLDNTRKARHYKILPHKYLKEYKYSIWVDAAFMIIGDLGDYVNKYRIESKILAVPHSDRSNLTEEMEVNIKAEKDDYKIIKTQIKRYKNEGFIDDNNLIESGLLFREHNNPIVINLMNDWYNEIMNYSKRDQLSFTYVCWKNNFEFDTSDIIIWKNPFIEINPYYHKLNMEMNLLKNYNLI